MAAAAAVAAAAQPVVTVAAVVVTYNRRDLLLESLRAIAAQAQRPDLTIVVDNASTDGTVDALRGLPDVEVHRLRRNTGGAGGFAYGIGAALRHDVDLIWLMDDDTVPEPDALAELVSARSRYSGRAPTLVASAVLWTDARAHPMNTPRPKPFATRHERDAAEQVRCVPVRSASFVSILLDAQVCRERGAPIADYFLWNDDFEYTTRLLRDNVGLLCPYSVVVHKTRTFGATDADPGERFFFEVRNKVWMLTRSGSLAPVERLAYAGSTLRRWFRTVRASADRLTLVRQLMRGLWSGVVRSPRPNEVVLADVA